jgi:glycine betaine/proline transport system ATP-binding protein
MDSNVKIKVENLTMIFGKNPHKEALSLFKEGISKDEILKRTGHVVGVADASFEVRQGEIFVVMGLSGSGKSTLIRCLNRLIEPTSGHVYIDNEDVLAVNGERLRKIRQEKMGMVFQHFALFPHWTVVDNVAYGLKIRKISPEDRREAALKALELVGLAEWADKYPKNLSGGMKQRVGLARALATDPDILLMDEAFSALDPLIRRQMQNEMMALQERLKKTVVFITHDLNEALRVGNHIVVMRDGKIVQIGTPVEIVTQPADDYVAAFTQDVDHGRVLTAEFIMTPADVLMLGRDAVQSTLNRIRNKDDVSAWYVVDGEQKVEGLIHSRHFMNQLKKGGVEDLSQVINREYPRINKTTPLSDIYALCADGVPIAVLDKAGRLQGVINPLDVFSNLAQSEQLVQDNVRTMVDGQENGEHVGKTDEIVSTG